MLFDVQEKSDISLKALSQIGKGGSVVKTPHVGNWYPNNLAVAKTGIRMIAYDRNYGKKDSNFHPHRVIVGGKKEKIGSSEKLCSHLEIKREPACEEVSNFFSSSNNIAECHMKAVRTAVPESKVETFTDYLLRHKQEVLAIVEKVTPHFDFWERKVLSTGEVFRSSSPDLSQLQEDGIYGLTDQQEGWLIPNEINILLCGVLEALDYGVTELFHLSGPDMINYVGSTMRKQLNKMYELVLEIEELENLPQQLTFNIVPASRMRFTVPKSKRKELDALVDSYLQLCEAEDSFGERIQSASAEDRSLVIEKVEQERKEYQNRLRKAVDKCPEVFYKIKRGRYFSQYDILRGEQLYIHPWGLEATMKEMKQAFDTIERYCKDQMP